MSVDEFTSHAVTGGEFDTLYSKKQATQQEEFAAIMKQMQEEAEGMAHPYSGPDAAKKFEKMKKRARARFEKYQKDWGEELKPEEEDDDIFFDDEEVTGKDSAWRKAQRRSS